MVEVSDLFGLVESSGEIVGGKSLLFVLAFFTIVIILYAVFVYFFYRFLAKKNIIELNLAKYNYVENSGFAKFLAGIFYIIEYIVILPIVTFFWFAFLAILILTLAEGLETSTVLLISAALVSSVRVTSYISERLSQDLAKMLPFTLLAIAITNPHFFEVSSLVNRLYEIPSLFYNIWYFIIFIIVVELIMRVLDLIKGVLNPDTEETSEMDEE